MRKSRRTEEQSVGIVKESEAGLPAAELCRKDGNSEQTFYRWKAKYGGRQAVRMAGHSRGRPSVGRGGKSLGLSRSLVLFHIRSYCLSALMLAL
jgi:hypothetical protein